MYTLLETNLIFLSKGTFEDDFPFPKVGYVGSLEGRDFLVVEYQPQLVRISINSPTICSYFNTRLRIEELWIQVGYPPGFTRFPRRPVSGSNFCCCCCCCCCFEYLVFESRNCIWEFFVYICVFWIPETVYDSLSNHPIFVFWMQKLYVRVFVYVFSESQKLYMRVCLIFVFWIRKLYESFLYMCFLFPETVYESLFNLCFLNPETVCEIFLYMCFLNPRNCIWDFA